jgi:hypothetical protein
MEVVSDQDVDFLRQQHALKKQGRLLDAPGLGPGWYVAVRHASDVATLRAHVEPLIQQLARERLEGPVFYRVSDGLRALGVEYAEPTLGKPDLIYITSEGWNTWTDSISLPAWVDRVLEQNPDVAKKLLAVPARERHIFIWATFGSSMSMRRSLRADHDFDAHLAPPQLPPGVDHVWVGCTTTGHRCVRWSASSGWVDTGWVTLPEDEES